MVKGSGWRWRARARIAATMVCALLASTGSNGARLAAKQTAPTGESVGVIAASAGVAGTAPGGGPPGSTEVAPAGLPAAKPGSDGVENASASMRSADAEAALQGKIARLPPLVGTNMDVAGRGAEVLAHLSAVLRFYRAAVAPVQKVGEPSDVLYAEQSQGEATEIAALAFQAAKNEAALLNKMPGAASANPAAGAGTGPANLPQGSEVERLISVRTEAQGQLATMQTQDAALRSQMARAHGGQSATLGQREEQLQGGIKLQEAIIEALSRIISFSPGGARTGLAGNIDQLEHSAPELLSKPVKTPAPPVLQSFAAAHDAGVSTQAGVLFQLLGTLHTIDGQIEAIDALSKQANDLRTPFVKVLRTILAQGQALTQQAVDPKATPAVDAQELQNTRQQLDQLTTTFQVLAQAILPLSQEALLLDNARGTLTTWRATVSAEYTDILRSLLIRVACIAIALGLLAVANRLLSHAAVKYVNDLRRRRQLLLLRRIVIGFFTGLVLIFGFVTQFSSLATFAGFITAGIAVGLQSILLSVAAYFFIVGRYGVRVGDRITVAGVTGEVIEVGLVRFYMSELVGTGTELHSTGRVAVFANSVLFQTGTPIYKQMPGTEYAWHELTAKLNSGADVRAASDAVVKVVHDVYASYQSKIEAQHRQVEAWMGTALALPQVESRLQLVDGGLQLAVLFPVGIHEAARVDQQIAEVLVEGMRGGGPLKAGVAELPVIKAAVKS